MSNKSVDDVYHHAGDNLPSHSKHDEETLSEERVAAYWRQNVRLLLSLLVIWFFASFGAGILFFESLNAYEIAGFPLGFWFAQQGAIYVFVVLIFVYAWQMKKIEKRFGVDDEIVEAQNTAEHVS